MMWWLDALICFVLWSNAFLARLIPPNRSEKFSWASYLDTEPAEAEQPRRSQGLGRLLTCLASVGESDFYFDIFSQSQIKF